MKNKNTRKINFSAFITMGAVFIILPAIVLARTIQLPKTGQTKCYDIAGWPIDCTGTGQDGDIQAGVAWPSPRFTDNGNETVTDNLTGLMWTKDANPANNMTWQQAFDYVKTLNTGGYTDWHLPNINELKSLVDYSQYLPALPLGHPFTNVLFPSQYYHWSATTFAYNTGDAWIVYMNYGYVISNDKSSSYYYAWPVRGGQCGSLGNSVICLPRTGQTTCWDTNGNVIPCTGTEQDGDIQAGVAWPSPRFTDNGNETVTDNLTGLMWTKDANSAGNYMDWWQALDYVKTLNTGGHTDWHLPNINELKSLVDYSQYLPALPLGHPFTRVQSNYYWSSTTRSHLMLEPYMDNMAWIVNMSNGDVYGSDKYYSSVYTWPVRSGGSFGPTVINLSYLTAAPMAGKVIFVWNTESETDNAGFNIYRAESENGEYTKINLSLIPAKGSSTKGASYEFIDSNVQNRKTYYYKLADIDLNGTSKMHEPVSATPRLIYWMKK